MKRQQRYTKGCDLTDVMDAMVNLGKTLEQPDPRDNTVKLVTVEAIVIEFSVEFSVAD